MIVNKYEHRIVPGPDVHLHRNKYLYISVARNDSLRNCPERHAELTQMVGAAM